MRLGIWTPLPHTIRAEPAMEAAIADLTKRGTGRHVDRSLQFAVDVIDRAERLGFATTLIAERFLGPDLEAWIMTAALAMKTGDIELMVAVHPGIVAPQVVAKMGASLDRISGGRLALNIVNGWWQQEFDLFANGGWLGDMDRRYRRMDEFVQVIKGLWTEDTFSFDGEFYRFESASLPITPVRTPHPPIYAASRTAPGKEIVARECDVWFVPYELPFRHYEESFRHIEREVRDVSAQARALGRSVSFGISAHVICEPTLEAAEAKADALEEYGKRDRVSFVAAKALGAGLVGTPHTIAERLRRYEDIGVDCFMLHYHPMMEGLEVFAAEVMPLLPRTLRDSESERTSATLDVAE
jgi:FMNH2-dependent dimethyl sulfone monooxygenase